jgi:D-alanyl-D-alanine carboxypeptidase/D-alanyl-D-alanine-endopeptidase (penicillin-binding protein 4)
MPTKQVLHLVICIISWSGVVPRRVWPAAIVAFCFICIFPDSATAQDPVLQHLAATTIGGDQGVFVQAEDGTILAAQHESRPVHPASVTKVATSLALLEKLGPNYRFDTQFLAGGPVINGSLHGDLVVRATGDPSFIFENAFLMLQKLHAQGLREVKGDLKVEGTLIFNWKPDPMGQRLKRALQGLDGGEAWAALGEPSSRLKDVALHFLAEQLQQTSEEVLIENRSPPLITIVKALNGYSNNVFHLLSDRIGGPQAVEALVRMQLPLPLQSEVTVTNAAGAGELNRLSPRAAVAILWNLRRYLRAQGKELPSVLPVNSLDVGTLKKRLGEEPYRGCIVGKTGTFGSVGATALVGVLRTSKYGHVAFAVLNSWLAVPEARHRQDVFLRALIDATHAKPWDYVSHEKPIFSEAIVDPRSGAVPVHCLPSSQCSEKSRKLDP